MQVFHRMPLMFGFDGLIKELSKSNSEDLGLNIKSKSGLGYESFEMFASNVFAVAPSRSSDGYTIMDK